MGEDGKGNRPTVASGKPGLQAVPSELPAGATLGERYLVLDALGQGGFGSVYRATDLVLDRDVPLKVLQAEGGEREGDVELLASEARAKVRYGALSDPELNLRPTPRDRRRPCQGAPRSATRAWTS